MGRWMSLVTLDAGTTVVKLTRPNKEETGDNIEILGHGQRRFGAI